MAGEKGNAALIEFIAKGIVSDSDAIKVHELDDGKLLELETTDDDRGRVIGRQGRESGAQSGGFVIHGNRYHEGLFAARGLVAHRCGTGQERQRVIP